MPLIEEGIEYLTATEAASTLGISRQQFYEVVRPTLETCQVGVRTRAYYRAEDIRKKKGVKTEGSLPIIVHGIQKNFVKSIQALGIPCTVENVGVPELVPIDDKELADTFGVALGTLIVRRGRLQGVKGTPYRLVTNWYPTRFADSQLLEEMKRNEDADMPALMKAKHGVVIEHIVETIITRKASQEERKLLKMTSPGAVFEVRRINYATDGETAVMVSDLVLVAQYFKLKYTYDTPHWKD